MKYHTPEMNIVQLEVGDIITSSPFGEGEYGNGSGEPEIDTPKDWS